MMSPIYFAYQFLLSKRMPVMLLALLLSQYSIAQTDSVFKMTKEHGRIKAAGHRIDITGQFIVDLGNASLLFLNRYDAEVDKLMSDSRVHLIDIHDNRRGKTYSQAFRVDKLTICDRTYHDDTVGVTTFKGLEGCGMLGLKFFTMPVVFDFDENKLYLCK